MDSIFHERQQGQLCAQHCINNLLQGPFFNAVDLAKLATELDEAEKTTLTEGGGMDSASLDKIITQPSTNMDDSGFFSVQVISKALEVWSLSMVPLSSPTKKEAMEHPTLCQAFICNQELHWFTVRKIGRQWFNLDSMKRKPELVSDTYLRLFLAQLQLEGYTIFVIEGNLPSSEADELLSLISVPAPPPHHTPHQTTPISDSSSSSSFSTATAPSSKPSFAEVLTGFFKGSQSSSQEKSVAQGGGHRDMNEEEDYQLDLAAALSASMVPGNSRDTQMSVDETLGNTGNSNPSESGCGHSESEHEHSDDANDCKDDDDDDDYDDDNAAERYQVEITAAMHASLEDQLDTEHMQEEERPEDKMEESGKEGSKEECTSEVVETQEPRKDSSESGGSAPDTVTSEEVDLDKLREKRLKRFT